MEYKDVGCCNHRIADPPQQMIYADFSKWVGHDGVEFELDGVVVYIPNTDKAYLPLQAVQAIKGNKNTLPSVAR